MKDYYLIGNYQHYEMCCFNRKMSAPKRLMDSKVWCQLSFLLMGTQDKNTKNSIKSIKELS